MQRDNMDAVEYLDRCGVTAYMKDVVTLLLENRPAQPIEFICKYFRTVTQGTSSPLLRAYRYVQLAQPHQPAFVDNLVAAYAALDSRRGASSVTGTEVARLLRLVCADCPIDISQSLLLLLDRSETEPISFEEFSAVVRAGILYEEFFRRACSLFAACDPGGTGKVPKAVLQLALRHARGELDVGALKAAHRHERGREEKAAGVSSSSGVANGAAAAAVAKAGLAGSIRGGAGGGFNDDPPPVAARTELHRLQREVQWEIARLELATAGSGGPAVESSAPTVTLDEYLKELSAAASCLPAAR